MEKVETKENTFRFLIEALNQSTEELYKTRQREINILQKLLDAEQRITLLIKELAEAKYPIEKENQK